MKFEDLACLVNLYSFKILFDRDGTLDTDEYWWLYTNLGGVGSKVQCQGLQFFLHIINMVVKKLGSGRQSGLGNIKFLK